MPGTAASPAPEESSSNFVASCALPRRLEGGELVILSIQLKRMPAADGVSTVAVVQERNGRGDHTADVYLSVRGTADAAARADRWMTAAVSALTFDVPLTPLPCRPAAQAPDQSPLRVSDPDAMAKLGGGQPVRPSSPHPSPTPEGVRRA